MAETLRLNLADVFAMTPLTATSKPGIYTTEVREDGVATVARVTRGERAERRSSRWRFSVNAWKSRVRATIPERSRTLHDASSHATCAPGPAARRQRPARAMSPGRPRSQPDARRRLSAGRSRNTADPRASPGRAPGSRRSPERGREHW